ncbi:MAG: RNA polymerase Rpb6 [Flavobacteriales bacterium]|nr:RNA polymerase Rpb6 [Flavobacteriales bacterium]|tara:strand:- start:8525 stop:8971 length:447 start_codon:yes stop_codon:yes gene_type:complete
MDYKKTNAARTTISRDLRELADSVGGNVYELISILQSRANQIGVEIKEELIAKLDEFATPSDTLEEVFENQEQTEISRFYERLPKPTLIAIQELLEDNIYIREKVKEENLDLNEEIDALDLEDTELDDVEEGSTEEKTVEDNESNATS